MLLCFLPQSLAYHTDQPYPPAFPSPTPPLIPASVSSRHSLEPSGHTGQERRCPNCKFLPLLPLLQIQPPQSHPHFLLLVLLFCFVVWCFSRTPALDSASCLFPSPGGHTDLLLQPFPPLIPLSQSPIPEGTSWEPSSQVCQRSK